MNKTGHMMKLPYALTYAMMTLLLSSTVYAAHPLITDDTGTQGKGKFQLEVNGQYDYEKDTIADVSIKETGGQAYAILSYGIVDKADIVVTVPHQWDKVEENGVTTSKVNGFSDSILEVKWRFYEKDGLSVALKPGVIIPTGDDEKGLGSGKVGYSAFFIITREIEPWAFHMNLGYKRNENTTDARNDIWHASVAAVRAVTGNLKAVANIGIESNEDKASNTSPAFVLGGLIYSITENFDVDLGYKAGLNNAEPDYSILAGITMRF
jgi:opacity protein-like surface antigen